MSRLSSSKISETDWHRIDAMEDKDIDLSDIPEVTEAQLQRARLRVGGQTVSRGKQRVNMFLDKFVVEYFKAQAGDRGYQTLINSALVEYIQNHDLKEDLRQLLREELSRVKNVL
ncbi:MAG: BrnA antitoxin family protein [Cyanobacteria bacterium J06554_11]